MVKQGAVDRSCTGVCVIASVCPSLGLLSCFFQSLGFDALRWGSRPLCSSLSSFYLSFSSSCLVKRCLTRLPPSPTCPSLPTHQHQLVSKARKFPKKQNPSPSAASCVRINGCGDRKDDRLTDSGSDSDSAASLKHFPSNAAHLLNRNQSSFDFGKDRRRNFSG